MPVRFPRYSRIEQSPKITINKSRHRLLEAIGKFSYLSAYQLTHLLYSKGALQNVRDNLKLLYQARYVRRVYLPHLSRHRGSPLAVYCLDRLGYQYLKSHGLAPEGRFSPNENAEKEVLFLRHTQSANDLLILARLLAQEDPDLELYRMLTERELKRQPVYVHVGRERVGVVPDGWVDLRKGNLQACIAFELDRNTVSKNNWQRKVLALAAYSQGPYQEAFDTESLTIAVVTTASERRLNELLNWTEAVLDDPSGRDFAPFMFFASFDPAAIEPRDTFYSPIWRQPFSDSPLPLLEL